MTMSYVGEAGAITVRWLEKEDDNKMSTASKVNVLIEVQVDAHPFTSLNTVLENLLDQLAEKHGVNDLDTLDTPMILETNPVLWYNEVMELKGN